MAIQGEYSTSTGAASIPCSTSMAVRGAEVAASDGGGAGAPCCAAVVASRHSCKRSVAQRTVRSADRGRTVVVTVAALGAVAVVVTFVSAAVVVVIVVMAVAASSECVGFARRTIPSHGLQSLMC